MKKTTGQLIVEAREMAGLKQADLAQKLGWQAARLSHYENDRRDAGLAELADIAHALGIRLSSLTDALDRPIPLDQLTNRELMLAVAASEFTLEETAEMIADLSQKFGSSALNAPGKDAAK